jgi:hypothetical protein
MHMNVSRHGGHVYVGDPNLGRKGWLGSSRATVEEKFEGERGSTGDIGSLFRPFFLPIDSISTCNQRITLPRREASWPWRST